MAWASGDSLNPTNMNNQIVSNLTVEGTLSVGTLTSSSGVTSTFSSIKVDSGVSWVYSGGWLEGDAYNSVNQTLKATDGASGTGPIGLANYTEQTEGGATYPIGFFNTFQYNSADNHTGWVYPNVYGFEHNGSGDITRVELLVFSGGLATGSSGDVGTMIGVKCPEPYRLGSGSIGTWYSGHFQGALSLLSSSLSLPTADGNPYLYVDSAGSLFFVNGSGASLGLA